MKLRVLGGVLIVFALWIGITLLLPAVANWLWPNLTSDRAGHLGEAFGGVAGLFAGLGSLGVVIVLAYDLRHRKEEFRPFVAIAIDQAKLSRASWSGSAHFSTTVDITLTLSSITAAPALNLQMVGKASIAGGTVNGDVVLADSPLPSTEPRAATINFTVTGQRAEAFVASLTTTGTEIAFTVQYDALNSTPWKSSVTFVIKARSRDQDDVKKSLDRDDQFEIEPSSGSEFAIPPVILESQAEGGSWKQERG